ncbi:Myb-like DNA-binding domain [Phytophthora infestans]|uniref:Myb-like DNA-binding domain n=1 Tax=Phytophthora infestans TaxID=4787 RepID=A0A8S9U223_PHYIN|nr:Myb-like DNA-binding domain [Phytophthora infestans]
MTRQSDSTVLQPPKKILLSTLRVKVMTAEPGSSMPPNDSVLKHQHRFQNWFKASLKWCVKALTLCCLRQPKRTSYTEIRRGPTLGSKPTISSNARGNSSSIEFVSLQSPSCEPVQKHARSVTDSNTEDKADDLNTRSARVASREIEWSGKRLLSPVKSNGTMKKSGTWSRDEHERYCEALGMYRYGSWKQIADHVGSRTERQVLSHAQSIRARKKKDEQRKASTIASRLSLLETRKATPEELLAASMEVPVSVSLPSFVDHRAVVMDTSADTSITDLPPWDLSFELDLSFTDEFEVNIPIETTQAATTEDSEPRMKRSKQNMDTIVTFDAPLTSSPLEISLDGVLNDEDLLDLLEVLSPRVDVGNML